MAADRVVSDGDGSLADTVLVSNRGPLAFHLVEGRPEPTTAGGGLAGALRPLVAGTGATWVAAALGEADRAAAGLGMMVDEGIRIELVDPDPELFAMAYNLVSNGTLWFCHHHLFDAARRPRIDRRWGEAWDAYRELNQLFALRLAKVAPEGARILVQDYHLALVGTELGRLRPDLRTAHFTHTPFADPSVLRMLPNAASEELLSGMAAFGACGFHSERWAVAYRAGLSELEVGSAGYLGPNPTFVSPLSVDPERLVESAARPAVAAAGARLDEWVGDPDRQVVVRVDRMELSKNLLRGFWAFDELLEREPRRRGRVVFVALAYPTRQGLPEYLAYQNEVESTVERINDRWATADWTPIVLDIEDDYDRSLAALTRYDVLLVNPVRDGLNLVAKEGPLVNTRHGVLALSQEAGAFDELGPASFGLNPFDVSGTAEALGRALDFGQDERVAMADELVARIRARRPSDWLDDQLAAVG
jgi:trehalose 6-phosphate synthase